MEVYEVYMEWYNAVSLVGLFALLGTGWLFSADRKHMNWRLIGWGIGLQLAFGLFVFLVLAPLPEQYNPFLFFNELANRVLESASAGARFVFGDLATSDNSGFILAFQAFPTIIFFSAVVGILYYYRIMPALIRVFSRVFTRLMRISGAESVCAASNIFVGVESALSVRPHLPNMTRSELCTVLTAGMATVAATLACLMTGCVAGVFFTHGVLLLR